MNAATTESGIGEYGNALIWEDDAEAMKELEEAMKGTASKHPELKPNQLALLLLYLTYVCLSCDGRDHLSGKMVKHAI